MAIVGFTLPILLAMHIFVYETWNNHTNRLLHYI